MAEVTQDELDAMSEEELNEYEKSLESDESEIVEEDTQEESEDTANKDELEKELDSDESTEEVEETQESKEESPETDKRFKDKSKEDVEKSYYELEQLQKRQATELGIKRKEAERIAELEKRIEELSKPPETAREKFDPEKYSNLLVDDPMAAAEYYHDLFVVPKAEEREQERQAKLQEMEAEKTQQENLNKTVEAFDEFFKNEEFKDLSQEEANKFGTFIRETIQPPKSGYFTVKDLERAYGWFNPEKAIITAKKDLLDKVSDAAPKVKTLSSASGAKVKSTVVPKGLNAQEMADWAEANMTKDEMEKYLNDAE